MKKIAKFTTGVLWDFRVVLICYFALQLMVTLFYMFTDSGFESISTFAFVWIGLMFLIPYLILKKRGLNSDNITTLVFFVFFGGLISTILTKEAYSMFFNIYKWEIIERNYVGISDIDPDLYKTMTLEERRSVYKNGFVFTKNDSRIESKHKKTQEELRDVSSRSYIFWQSALADDFDPKYISVFNSSDKLSDRIELYFTVGPLRIVESFFVALRDTLLFLIVPVIMRLFGKRLFFSDINSLIQFIKYDFYK